MGNSRFKPCHSQTFQHESLDSSLTELKTMCSSCGCKSAETGKKNCGCGQDPCKTYGAESSTWAKSFLKAKKENPYKNIEWHLMMGNGERKTIEGVEYAIFSDNSALKTKETWINGELDDVEWVLASPTRIDKTSGKGVYEAETFESEYDELLDLSNKAKERYMDVVEEWEIEDFCDNYDLDYNDSNDRERAISKYLEQMPFDRIIEALDEDDQKRYYELKDSLKSYGAETFEAKSHTDGDGFTWKLVSQEYAKKNWKNEEIYWLDTSDDTESLIDESNYEIYTHPDFANELFGIECTHKFGDGEDAWNLVILYGAEYSS